MTDLNAVDHDQLTHQPIEVELETEFEEILNILLENSLKNLKSALSQLETLLKTSYIFTFINYAKLISLKTK